MNKSKPNNYNTKAMQIVNLKHGGNVYSKAKKLNLLPAEIIDSSASLVPFAPPQILIDSLNSEIKNLGFRYYPERNLSDLKEIIGKFHEINPLTEKFNPDFHQAVSTIKDASKENDIVSEVVQQGYSLNGRVIKPALVIVIKNQ